MSTYTDKFRDSRWQQKRLEIMERDEWTCKSCGKNGEGVTLNVHHSYYEKGKEPWEYPSHSLVTYCEDCHKKRHEMMPYILESIAQMPMASLEGLLNLSMGEYHMMFSRFGREIPSDGIMQLIIHAASMIREETKQDLTIGD